MPRWPLALLLAIVAVGCPGQRRMPPWAVDKIREQDEAERRADEEARKPPPKPPSIESQLAAISARYDGLRARAKAFTATPTPEGRATLLGAIEDWQNRASKLESRLGEVIRDRDDDAVDEDDDDDDDDEDPRWAKLLDMQSEVSLIRASVTSDE